MRDLRDFITVVEGAWGEDISPQEIITESQEDAIDVVQHLRDLVFKLRSHVELDNSPDYCSGHESGCEMAASMIETLINNMGGMTK